MRLYGVSQTVINVEELHLENFMCHKLSIAKFPASGLVLVTGENGHGKSTIAEAISFGIWGKTLRGTTPWLKEAKSGSVQVVTDLVEAYRRRNGRTTALAWNPVGEAPEEYESATKAQDALGAYIGSFDIWRRSHVFSSQDAAHFTLATDKERKRLLETILGLDRFEPALQACRADLKIAVLAETQATRTVERLEIELSSKAEQISSLEEQIISLESVSNLDKLECRLEPIDGFLTKARTEKKALEKQYSDNLNQLTEMTYKLRTAEDMLQRVSVSKCPTCTQPIPKGLRESVKADVEVHRSKRFSIKAGLEETNSSLQTEIGELEHELEVLGTKRSDLKAEIAQAKKIVQLKEQQLEIRKALEHDFNRITASLDNEREAVNVANNRVIVLSAAEQVLGLKGVRAQVLGKALSGIEDIANMWLSRIANEDFKLRLQTYKENDKGDISDSISLEVIGAGGGLGYKAASGGERRRIDIALLLALGEVSAAANGTSPGTQIYDDVFDALDFDGISKLSEVLKELSEDRCVVVLSPPREDILDCLRPDITWTVSNGAIS